MDEKSSSDIHVVEKKIKNDWYDFILLFGWKTLKRIGDIAMGVENRLILRMNNPSLKLCS